MYMKPENIFAQIAEAGEEEQVDLLFKSPDVYKRQEIRFRAGIWSDIRRPAR